MRYPVGLEFRVCKHRWDRYVALPTSFGELAWLPVMLVVGDIQGRPQMWRCRACGEQGYEVPADKEPA